MPAELGLFDYDNTEDFVYTPIASIYSFIQSKCNDKSVFEMRQCMEHCWMASVVISPKVGTHLLK